MNEVVYYIYVPHWADQGKECDRLVINKKFVEVNELHTWTESLGDQGGP